MLPPVCGSAFSIADAPYKSKTKLPRTTVFCNDFVRSLCYTEKNKLNEKTDHKDVFALDTLKTQPEALKNALQDNSSVLKVGRELKKGFYGVPAERQNAFCGDMRKLKADLGDPRPAATISAKHPDLQGPAAPAEPVIPKGKDIPKTPAIPKLP